MAFTPTTEQQNIIDGQGDIIVSANAGCGKTTVMLLRIIKLIRDGNSIDRMLLTTFTKAAASDIKNKLGTMILEQEHDRERFDEQYSLLPQADISTLHSWCSKILRKYFYITGDDPAFEIAKDADVKMWLDQSIKRAVDEYLAVDSNYKLLQTRVGKSTDELEKKIKKIASEALGRVEGVKFFEDCLVYYADEQIISEVKQVQLQLEEQVKSGIVELRAIGNQLGDNKYAPKFADALEMAMQKGDATNFPRSAGEEDVKAVYVNTRAMVEEYLQVSDVLQVDNQLVQSQSEAMIAIAGSALSYFSEIKQRVGKLDFNDLERRAYEVLCSGVGDEIRASYDYIFIDEYQDINPTQQKIIDNLTGHANMFYVGDIKQSIYAFRNCSPDAFLHKLSTLPQKSIFKLSQNYRCNGGVQNFTNEVFSRIMTKETGMIDYASDGCFAIETDKLDGVCITIVPEEEKVDNEKKTFAEVYSVAAGEFAVGQFSNEAKAAVEIILKLLATEIKGKDGDKRMATYRDIVILVRNKKNGIELIELLKQMQIPVVSPKEMELTEEPLIADFISLLSLIDNNMNDITLLAVMSSYFGKFTEREICRIGKAGHDGFARRVMSYSTEGEQPLASKVCAFLAEIDKLSNMAGRVSLAQLCAYITAHYEYFNYLIGLSGGLAIAGELSDLLSDVSGYNGSLGEWLKYVGGVKGGATTGETNSVRIMTMHSSKGLEFPYVLLYDMGSSFKTMDIRDGLVDKEWGWCLKYHDEAGKKIVDTPLYYLATKKAMLKLYAEEMRILYVAMTRAINHMVIILPPAAKEEETGVVKHYAAWLRQSAMQWESGDLQTVDLSEKSENIGITGELELPKFQPPSPPVMLKTTATKQAHEYGESVTEQTARREYSGVDSQLAIDRGNAYHKALELYDYDTGSDYDTLMTVIPCSELVERDKFEWVVDCLGKSIAGKKIYRELPFMYKLEQSKNSILQGVIDMLIVTDDGCEIIDYKTGKITEKKLAVYGEQLKIYGTAVSELLAMKVNRMVIIDIDGKNEHVVLI